MLEKLKPIELRSSRQLLTAATAIAPASQQPNVSGNLSAVGPIINDAAGIMPYVLALVSSGAGGIIGMAVIRFVTGLFDSILQGMRFR
jgi:hypothetical protein